MSGSGEITYSSLVQISNSSLNKVSLFPNPATDKVQLQFYSAQKRILQFKVIDITGQVVDNIRLNVNSGYNYHVIEVQHLPAGTYQLINDKDPEHMHSLRFHKK